MTALNKPAMAYVFTNGRVLVFDGRGREIVDLAPGIEAAQWIASNKGKIPVFTKEDSEWPQKECDNE